MKRSIIGIIGRSRVGKDSAARYIQELLPEMSFDLRHIANPLKDSIANMYCLSTEQLHGNMKDVVDMRYGHSPRELCTIWNNKLTHLHGPKFLIHRFFEMEDAPEKSHTNIIIPDVRFCHDCYEIRRRGGILIKVVRRRIPLLLETENHIDHLVSDAIISNDFDLATFKKNIEERVIPLIKT